MLNLHRVLPPLFRLCACLLLICGLQLAHAENWPEFRGPTGVGHSRTTGLPIKWDQKTNVTWKKRTIGKAWSSPIFYNGRLYLTTAISAFGDDAGDQSLRMLCRDAKTGSQIWNKELVYKDAEKTQPIQEKNSHASPTPLTDGEHLYAHFGPLGTFALDLDGKVIWSNTTIKFNWVHGNGGSPIISGDLLIFTCDGGDRDFVTALNRKTGKIAWQTDRPPFEGNTFSFATPLEIEHQGKKQIVCPGANFTSSYDPTTGKELWYVDTSHTWSIVPRPVFSHGLVFVITGYGKPNELLAIKVDGTGNVTDSHIAWREKKAAPYNPSPLIIGDELYTMSDKGIATCFDVATGKVHWRERVGGNQSSSPLYAEGRIYFQSEEGEGVVIAAGKEFKELARNDLKERSLASYAVGDGALFIRTAEHLYRIETPSEQ
jgi:outer membrane protein assembly factor BamB